jgi:C4-dicarboxylate-specific signal transduction histidine kinase
MKWAIEHLQIIIAVAAAIAYWLNQRRQARAEDQPASPRQASDAEEHAQRTRRVQEEIRRKIAERRGEVLPPPAAAPAAPRERLPKLLPPLNVPPLEPFGGPRHRRTDATPPPVTVPPRDEAAERAALERQTRLAEQLRALEAARQAELRRAGELAARQRAEPVAAAAPRGPRADWREDLRDPEAMRRAIVLREILGKPVGLRGPAT